MLYVIRAAICHAHPPPLPPVVNDNIHHVHHGGRRVGHQHSDVRGDELDKIPFLVAGDNPLFSRFAFTDPALLLQLIERDERDLHQVLVETFHLQLRR